MAMDRLLLPLPLAGEGREGAGGAAIADVVKSWTGFPSKRGRERELSVPHKSELRTAAIGEQTSICSGSATPVVNSG